MKYDNMYQIECEEGENHFQFQHFEVIHIVNSQCELTGANCEASI